MNDYADRDRFSTTDGAEGHRLETPRSVGYRGGMSSTNLIGRRLASVYDAGADLPRAFGDLLSELDGKVPFPR